MRIESSVTSVSWIPSESMPGPLKAGFFVGATPYDEPPPEIIGDLDEMHTAERFRFANHLAAWIEVEDGHVVDAGYSGRGYISCTRLGWGPRREMTFQPAEFPEIRTPPEITASGARFAQTTGGRTGVPMPRPVSGRPHFRWEAPTVWTTLALAIGTDGSSRGELTGASRFPRHWVYDARGRLVAKSALADFGEWFVTAHGPHSPVVPGQVVGPIPAADGTAIHTMVQVNLGNQGWDKAARAVAAIGAITRSDAHGLASYVTGPLGNAADTATAARGIQSTLLYAALAVVIVILLITYRSPVLWLLPVISSGAALITAEALIYLLAARAGLTVNEESAAIMGVLVFGASTDYALLIVARYREELRRHDRRHAAMAEALRRAGPAVIASAATVIIALLMPSFAELNSTKGLCPVLAIGVAAGVAAMLTLLPALLVAFPRGIFWPYRPGYRSPEPTARGLWARAGRAIAPRPRIVWVTTAMLLGILALGLTGLKASGLTNAQSFRGHPGSVTGESVLATHFPAGDGDPVIVVGTDRAAARLRAVVAATPGIAAVTPPVARAGYAYLQGTLAARPDSQAGYATVDRVRAAVYAIPGAHALAGGYTAVSLDEARASAHDRNLILPLILVVVLAVLAVLLRALVAPLLLTATVVLSFAAALGVSAFFFTHLFGFGGADTTFPLFVFVFLVALGIDYNIFLMARVREETARRGARHGAITGLAATGGVITSAGLVLAGTFAVLATIPFTFLTELGFAVALGILLDTIIVRSVLVTALNLDLGRWMWWPSALAHKPAPQPAELGQQGPGGMTVGIPAPLVGSRAADQDG
jgi:putative drug exporter of the RND superfamily